MQQVPREQQRAWRALLQPYPCSSATRAVLGDETFWVKRASLEWGAGEGLPYGSAKALWDKT